MREWGDSADGVSIEWQIITSNKDILHLCIERLHTRDEVNFYPDGTYGAPYSPSQRSLWKIEDGIMHHSHFPRADSNWYPISDRRLNDLLIDWIIENTILASEEDNK